MESLQGLDAFHKDNDLLDIGLDMHGLSEGEQEDCYVRPVYHCCCISHPHWHILTLVSSCSWKAVCWLAISSPGSNIAAVQRIFPLGVHNHGDGGSDTLPTIHCRFSTSQVENISCFQLWHHATDMPGYMFGRTEERICLWRVHWLWLIRIATDHILYLSCCAVFSWWMASMVVTQMHRVWHSREGYLFGPKLCQIVVCLANHLTPSRLSSRNKHLKSLSSTSFKGDAKPGKTCTIASC